MVGDGNNCTFSEAFPYTEYSIQVNAKNGEHIGEYSSPMHFSTMPGESKSLSNVILF